MPWCCCWWGWCPGQGPARNSSLLSTKGGARVGCFFQTLPFPLPLMGLVPIPRLGLFQSTWTSQYVFKWNHLIYSGRTFLSAYMCDSVLSWSRAWCCYSRGLWVLDARTSLLRPSKAWAGGAAHCPPPLVSHVGAVDLQDKEVWSFFFFFFPFKWWWFRFFP